MNYDDFDGLKKHATQVFNKHGKGAVLEILGEFGVGKLAEVESSNYDAIAKRFDAVLVLPKSDSYGPAIAPVQLAVPAASAWLPMSTAPRDGTGVLLITGAGIVSACAWLEHDSGDEYGNGACDYYEWVAFDGKFTINDDGEALGWQPLPKD